MQYRRMPIEVESPEQMGYDKIRNNLSESSYTDTLFREVDTGSGLGDLVLAYGSHQGHEGLRQLVVKNNGLDAGDVLTTIGAAGALFIIATTLLEKGDELVVVRPNYATNIETPRAIGATVKYIDLRFEERFALDIDRIKSAITPNTRYISLTHPHNPTGACLEATQLNALAQLAEEKALHILVDETYRDMVFGPQLPLAAEYSPKMISISSLSKTYGLPGLRTGWIICRDRRLLETFLAAKEQMHICGPVIDEELAYRYLLQKDRHFPRISADIKAKFEVVKDWMQQQGDWEWIEPRGGCVCFPRLKDPQRTDLDNFYRILLEKYGTYVGAGHWFEMPRHYIRLGFGWPTKDQLQEGLSALSKAVEEASLSR
ncbi:pyridoxal phosphate-dependent aminotransferase [Puia dinghuensis]|uniref:Aminotransferase n=1 Tax=Puia dinghuensis TaxID=1792502 RepID=A0A8J2UF81_9BACT|nr:pyridoxal phosphate-dependent aminotransferase [Puia dinghuensis]GGB08723.1 aminotransferase [Puia dinghuensis]